MPQKAWQRVTCTEAALRRRLHKVARGGIGSIYRGKRLSLLPGLAMAACFRHTRRPVVAVFAVAIHLAPPDVLWLLLHLGGEENMEEAAGAESVTVLVRATSSYA